MIKKYRILEHPADIKIRAFGQDKRELFQNALLGMQAALRAKKQRVRVKRKIKIESGDLVSLLVDFLAEVNYLNETNFEIYDEVKFEKFSDKKVIGEVLGKKVEGFSLQIKGVTYHQLEVEQKKDGTWEATVLFDI